MNHLLLTITEQHAKRAVFLDEAFKLTAFASDLGLKPGCWPERIELPESYGNGQQFLMASIKCGVVTYQQSLGALALVIFND